MQIEHILIGVILIVGVYELYLSYQTRRIIIQIKGNTKVSMEDLVRAINKEKMIRDRLTPQLPMDRITQNGETKEDSVELINSNSDDWVFKLQRHPDGTMRSVWSKDFPSGNQ
jgi:hypothetical protein